MITPDALDLRWNVRITARERGKLIPGFTRDVHNVFINGGREWVARILGASNYAPSPPTAHLTSKIKYMGFGCGGALQTDPLFANSQTEVVTITALEDPVPFSRLVDVRTYLKTVENQDLTAVYFPASYRTKFIVAVAETEISFAGNVTRTSAQAVNTLAPISECGLYLSSAWPTYSHAPGGSEADPAAANDMVAYNTFVPIPLTPGVTIRAEWEMRL